MNLSQDRSSSSATGIKLAEELDQLSKTVPPLNLKTVLVPTDFSENSKKALIYAVRLAQRNDSSLILFHALELPEFVQLRPPDISGRFNEAEMKLFDDAVRRCEDSLVRLSRDLGASNVKIETLQRVGKPYEEIIKIARERGVDLIIVGTHGYTGLKHFLLGSTTERVVRVSPCPVLVVRKEEQDFV